MSLDLQGQLNNGFAFTRQLLASGDFTIGVGGNKVTINPGYNYVNFSGVGSQHCLIPSLETAARQYVVGDSFGKNVPAYNVEPALIPASAMKIVVSGVEGAGLKFNGQDAFIISGQFVQKTVLQVSGVNFTVF